MDGNILINIAVMLGPFVNVMYSHIHYTHSNVLNDKNLTLTLINSDRKGFTRFYM